MAAPENKIMASFGLIFFDYPLKGTHRGTLFYQFENGVMILINCRQVRGKGMVPLSGFQGFSMAIFFMSAGIFSMA